MALLLPNGMQTFVDQNGKPFSGGSVYMYVPNTTTDKLTWQDQAKTSPNAQPIPLDAAGRCTIWGEGDYRQILKDSGGNTIWDKIVSVYMPLTSGWCGTSTGSANNITMTLEAGDIPLNAGHPVGGQQIEGIAGFSNTDASELTVVWGSGSVGPIEIVKNSSGGPVPLVGGEIVQGNLMVLQYDETSGLWILQNAQAVGTVYVPCAFSIGTPVASLVAPVSLIRSYTLPAGAPGSAAYCEQLPLSDVTIEILKNTTNIGTVVFTSASNTGTITLAADVSFVATDRLVLVFPVTQDGNLGGVSVTFRLQRGA